MTKRIVGGWSRIGWSRVDRICGKSREDVAGLFHIPNFYVLLFILRNRALKTMFCWLV